MDERKLTPRAEFDKALAEHAGRFGVALDEGARARLGDYFELVAAWNPRLHLVAPCAPAEFATRHVLESLVALPYLREGASVVDVGSGAGLPIIPCLVARADLSAVLVEASRKKSVFLREALWAVNRGGAASVVAERFERLERPAADFLTCRALERFAASFDSLYGWTKDDCTLLLFGGPALRETIERGGRAFRAVSVPLSRQRFLYVVPKGS